jgi:uncharacterized repeat protein (TIGR01451 family)
VWAVALLVVAFLALAVPGASADRWGYLGSGYGGGGSQTQPPENTADVSLTMTADQSPVRQGSTLTYRLTVANAGPAPASYVRLDDMLPDGARFLSAAPSQGSCQRGTSQVVCDLSGIDPGSAATVDVAVKVTRSDSVTNSASVTGHEYDPDEGNNTATLTTPVSYGGAEADLVMANTVDRGTAGENETLTYTLTATNNGPSVATGVQVRDQLPSNVSFVSAAPSQGTCRPVNGMVECLIGGLTQGQAATVTITVTTTGAGTATNSATVTGEQIDPYSSNNSASAATQVGPVPAPSGRWGYLNNSASAVTGVGPVPAPSGRWGYLQ